MDITIYPKKLQGTVSAIPSKSQAHRLLICAAFADKKTTLYCPATNQDIEATAECLRALGADIVRAEGAYVVKPISDIPQKAALNCGESGSTLRFMLPIAAALGVDATFLMAGRLPSRPLSPLWEELQRMGCTLSRPTANTIRIQGQLQSGVYTVDGSVSSQFITGLLFASAILPGQNTVRVTGKIESLPYIQMTQDALGIFGVDTRNYTVTDSIPFTSPGEVIVEGDWSNAAFFLAANALGSNIGVENLNVSSSQGDRQIESALSQLSDYCQIPCEDIPDLVPILSIVAAAGSGAKFTGISRLRLKESDRVAAVSDMLSAFGASVTADENTMLVTPNRFRGCTIDAKADHRIAMAAAIGATVADGPVTILGAQCVCKSYPSFWDEYQKLGGHYEQHLR